MTKVGVMDLDSYFPAEDRFELAMSLNHLLASPSFANWMEGESLDIPKFLYTETGKPRLSIFSIAHLSDAERMFLVSLLLNQVLGWVRTQSGTSSLRAILYMDEIFGYFPPTANPPTKKNSGITCRIHVASFVPGMTSRALEPESSVPSK